VLDVPGLAASRGAVADARALRRAVDALARGAAAGVPPDPAALATVNAWAARPPLAPVLAADGTVSVARPATTRHALATLARDAVDLLASPLAARIRICAAPDCALLFVDASRPGRRRWCSMEWCGNRAKTRAYRRRDDRGAPERSSRSA